VLPLKYETYLKIRNREIKEGDLKTSDLEPDLSGNPIIFYYYSVYADSAENYYYIINRLLTYFQRNKFKNYIFAGISYRKPKIEFLLEIGLNNIWEEPVKKDSIDMASLMEGNFDEYLFGNQKEN
jgi:hypothetical protein